MTAPAFALRCRICDSSRVELFLDLGDQPHCNRFIPATALDRREPRFPLRVGFCRDCTLVQIDYTIPKEDMFSDYPYVSGTTRTLVEHFRQTASRLATRYSLGAADLVVDIGSNDGSWLSAYAPFGIQVLGVEPAANVAPIALANGVPTLNRFFNLETARLIQADHGAASLVTAAGVFFHLEQLHEVVQGIAELLAPDGVLVVQAIYLGHMIENLAFDQIYHEHLCYYTLRSIERLLSMFGLEVFDVSLLPIHGGSMEIHAARHGSRSIQPTVAEFRATELRKGFGSLVTYQEFAARVWTLRDELLGLLSNYSQHQRVVYAYGAPAKGSTLLNSFGIDSRLVPLAVEKNPMKVGYWIPGARIPIVAEDTAGQPDAYLVLAWNFLDEFLDKEAAYLRGGGEFIVPVPRVRIVTGDPIA
jgi:SAM-dependent methyltransferase